MPVLLFFDLLDDAAVQAVVPVAGDFGAGGVRNDYACPFGLFLVATGERLCLSFFGSMDSSRPVVNDYVFPFGLLNGHVRSEPETKSDLRRRTLRPTERPRAVADRPRLHIAAPLNRPV
jgi:hypothetical protein